ncbi:hypothetical protein QBC38DRAFT_508136 [Podospora fimiseda]|uniref:Signal peptide-containing protein n=1 Tax=Podospora fimiseda TaxID=252190 RepID=A0AAN7BTX4_9PEZI|nr:hypothetical protein QBC38DRAFT_508136 [Podospora fimiseda]
MSYFAAAQSAIFYFLACTPCNQVVIRHKAAKTAKKEREEKARIVMQQPKRYRQPDPFQTNPYWAEEISMGPSLPRKGRAGDSSKTESQRRLTTASRDGTVSIDAGSSFVISMGSPGSVVGPRPSISPTINTVVNTHSRVDSTPTVVPEHELISSPTLSKTVSVSTAGDWNSKSYQREDEELWGHDGPQSKFKLVDALKQAGSSAGRFVESKLKMEKPVTEEDRYNFYNAPRNPSVNDYHPPIVSSKPAHKDGLRWMLQPPPSAKVMEGKVPVSRSASVMSVGSRRTVSTIDGASSLGRLVGEKAYEARIRRGETPHDSELRSSASLNRTRSRMTTASRARSRRTARGNSFSTESEDSEGEMYFRRRPSTRQVYTPEVDSDDEKQYMSSKALEAGHHSPAPTHAAQKPRLATIRSSSNRGKSPSPEKAITASPLHEAKPLTHEVINKETGLRDTKAKPFTVEKVPLAA